MDPGLYEAVTSGDVDFLKRKIGDGDLLSQRTPKYNNILHLAAEFKHINVFTEVPPGDQSPLFWAANKYGDTPLHVAARVGCNEVITFLIEHSKKTLPGGAADVESGPAEAEAYKELLRVTNLRKDTAFHVAVQHGHNEVVNLLMAADPELCCFTNSANESPLFIAVRKDFYLIAHSILRCPISPSFEGTDGVTALHAAVTHRHKSMRRLVKIMVSKKADIIERTDAIGWTPLHYAALRGYLKITRLLLIENSFVSYNLDESGMSALHIAACAGRTRVLKELIRCRPDTCDLLNDKGQNILHAAVLGRQRFIIRYILKNPKLSRLINEADKEGNTPLHLAVIYYRGDRPLIRCLTLNPRVDQTVINNEFSHAVDILTSQNFKQGIPTYHPRGFGFGRNVGVPAFHKEILHEIMAFEPKENNTSSPPTSRENWQANNGDKALKTYDTTELVAVLIATVTFAAAFTIPGGFKSDGTPVLYGKAFFPVFLVSNAFSFFTSILVLCLHFLRVTAVNAPSMGQLLRNLVLYSLQGMVIAFSSGIFIMIPKSGHPVAICLLLICGLPKRLLWTKVHLHQAVIPRLTDTRGELTAAGYAEIWMGTVLQLRYTWEARDSNITLEPITDRSIPLSLIVLLVSPPPNQRR